MRQPLRKQYATTTGGPGSFRDGHMNFNTTQMDALTGDELCDIMLHEMLHWTGEGFSGDHDQGVDTREHARGACPTSPLHVRRRAGC